MGKGQFKIQKVSDVGTSNPIVSRLSMGLHDIIEMAQINKEYIGPLTKEKLGQVLKQHYVGIPD